MSIEEVFFVITASLWVGFAIWIIGKMHISDEQMDKFVDEQVKAGNGPFNAMKKLPWWMR